MSNPSIDLTKHIEKLLVRDFVAACVIVNHEGEILYFHNRTGKYLEPAQGNANLNIFQMARQGLPMVLTTSFYKAVQSNQDVVYENVEVATNGDTQLIHLIIHPIQDPPALQGLILVMFENARQTAFIPSETSETDIQDARDQRILKLERELQFTQEYLQTTREELETSNEELKSTNEELQSANEELQSTNEELETSKEEVNSVNEELITANLELQAKIEGLSRANNDLQNLLNSVEIGIIFLDNQLNIQRFNPAIKEVFNLIEADMGRSITHITSNFEQADLKSAIETVLKDLSIHTVEIYTAKQNWYLLQIRPYRTLDNVIDGVVMTFNDITQQKLVQTNLQQLVTDVEETRDYADTIIKTIRHPFVVLDQDFMVISANYPFYNLFQTEVETTVDIQFFELGNEQWNIPQLKTLLQTTIREDVDFNDFLVEHDFPDIGHKKFILNGRKLKRANTQQLLILVAIEEIID